MTAVAILVFFVVAAFTAVYFQASSWMLLAATLIPAVVYLSRRPATLAGVVLAVHAWPFVTLAGGIGVTPFKFAVVLLAAVVGAAAVRSGGRTVPTSFFVALLVFLALNLIAELDAPTGSSFQRTYILLGTFLSIGLTSQIVQTVEELDEFVRPLIVNLVILAAWMLYNTSAGALWGGGERVHGMVGNANTLAFVAMAPLPIAGVLVFNRARTLRSRVFAGFAFACGALTIMASGSRGCTLGAAVGVLSTALVLAQGMRQRLISVVAVAVVLAAAVAFAPTAIVTRLQDSVSSLEATQMRSRRLGLSLRDEHVKMGFEMIPERPLFGHGSTGFEKRRSMISDERQVLHSAFVSVAVTCGVPGGLLYLALFLFAIRTAWLGARRGPIQQRYAFAGLVGTIAGLAVALQASPMDYTPRSLLWMSMAHFLGWGLLRNRQVRVPVAADSARRPALVRRTAYYP